MASIVQRNKSYSVVYTIYDGEKKRQKWETYQDDCDVSEFFAHCFAMSLLIEPDLLNSDPFKTVPLNLKQMFRTYFHYKIQNL